MMNYAITVKDVSKSFKLPHERYSSLKQSAIHLFGKKSYSKFTALKKVDIKIKQGEFFGIVGKNGSGKSTLLKLLAGIYTPGRGEIVVNGLLSPFIELGVGFNPELTARENVFLNGAILGLSRKEIESKFNEIIQFAELEEFVDQKLKNFSSGMQVRLAFSISVQVQADILLVDEVLAVGDSSFQEKCYDVFRSLKKAGKTIVFVTHDMATVREFCDRVMILNNGEQVAVTSPSEAADIYSRLNAEASVNFLTQAESETDKFGTKGVEVSDVKFLVQGKSSRVLETGRLFSVQIKYTNKIDAKTATFGLAFHSSDGVTMTGPNTTRPLLLRLSGTVSYQARCLFLPGNYKLTVGVFDAETGIAFDYRDKVYNFVVQDNDLTTQGLIELEGEWSAA
jgi:ABC-type polysaccharide/polyol phosphate transport system ATPase subunit